MLMISAKKMDALADVATKDTQKNVINSKLKEDVGSMKNVFTNTQTPQT